MSEALWPLSGVSTDDFSFISDTALERQIQHLVQYSAGSTVISFNKTVNSVADGWYAKHAFINGGKALGLELITRLRADANMHWLYEGEQKARGRKESHKMSFFTVFTS